MIKPSKRLSLFLLDITSVIFSLSILLTCYIFPSYTTWGTLIIIYTLSMYSVIFLIYLVEQIFDIRFKSAWVSNNFFVYYRYVGVISIICSIIIWIYGVIHYKLHMFYLVNALVWVIIKNYKQKGLTFLFSPVIIKEKGAWHDSIKKW